jgi:hypothetical protein
MPVTRTDYKRVTKLWVAAQTDWGELPEDVRQRAIEALEDLMRAMPDPDTMPDRHGRRAMPEPPHDYGPFWERVRREEAAEAERMAEAAKAGARAEQQERLAEARAAHAEAVRRPLRDEKK